MHQKLSKRTVSTANVDPALAGVLLFRLVALGTTEQQHRVVSKHHDPLLRDKGVLLRELQHRVKNNRQIVRALFRMEARNVADDETGERFDRLAGRINSLALLYDLLNAEGANDSANLGVYVSKSPPR